jgi:hypothetical protein
VPFPLDEASVTEPVTASEMALVWALLVLASASMWLLPILLR